MRMTPWLTPDAVRFLEDFVALHPDAKMLEFGCGGSTIWFAEHRMNLISIEHDPTWHESVKKELEKRGKTVDLRLLPRPYDSVCNEFVNDEFGLVLVDGRDRVRCVQAVISKIKPGGVLMLDNSERSEYIEAINLLSKWPSCRTHTAGEGHGPWDTTWWTKPEVVV